MTQLTSHDSRLIIVHFGYFALLALSHVRQLSNRPLNDRSVYNGQLSLDFWITHLSLLDIAN